MMRQLLHSAWTRRPQLPAPALGMALAMLVAATPAAHALDPEKRFHDYVKDAWSIEEGLPQITALTIEQDAEDYLWVGTQAGIARFDGIRFTSYSPENTPALPGLFIHDVMLDSRDRLWIATYKGLAVRENRTFRRVPYRVSNDEEESIDIRMLAETADGEILAAAVEGLFRVAGDRLLPVGEFRDGQAYSLHVEDRTLYVGGVGEVYRLERELDGEHDILALPAEEANALVTHLVPAQGTFWAGTSHGLFYRSSDRWERFTGHGALSSQPIDALFEDSDGNLWVGTHQGLGRIRDSRLHEFIPDDDPAAHRNIRSIYEDHEGNLWLGSQWQGIARLWNGWTRRYAGAYGLHDPVIWSLTRASDGTLWVGTNRGLSRFDGERYEIVIPEEELPHPNAYTLLDDGDRLWVGTRTGLVWYQDGRHWMPDLFAPLATTQVSGIVKDSRGVVWIAANNGVYRYEDGELFRYGEEQGLTEPRTRLIYETPSGRLYVGTREGLFEIQGSRARRIGVDAGLREDIDVTAITELSDGSLVLGTLSEELFLHADGDWFEYTVDSGLPVNSPFFLAEDARNFLWAAGIRGLFRVPIEDLHRYRKGEITSVDAEMLLSERGDHRGSQKTYCCNGAGNAKGFIENEILWLPTRGGVIAVDTRNIEKNRVAPNVTIERLRYGNQWRTWLPGEPFRLDADLRDITVEFSTLSFQQPTSVVMRYRLDGYDDDWRVLEDGSHRSASYTNLPPGEYVFETTGTNNAGVWAEEPARMPFSITPYLHETTWFRLLLLAALLIAIYAGYRFQLRHLHAQRAELERVVRRRTEELRIANRSLQEMTVTDPLTGLNNRRYLQEQLPVDLAFYDREALKPGGKDVVMVFALIDVDHFKRINDEHGHHAGDLVLQQFGALLKNLVRTGDYVVRWGGEEFLVVFRPMPREMSTRIAERIRKTVEDHTFTIEGGLPLELTASVGFVEYPLFRDNRGPLRWEDMVELADHALYYVKSRGRNGWAALRPTQTTRVETVVDEVRLHLDALIDHGDIEVVFKRGEKSPL